MSMSHIPPKTHPVKSFFSYSSEKLNPSINFPVDSLVTDQSFRDECDINTIMARYQSTGEMPIINNMEQQWLDVTQHDFQTHMNFIVEAQSMFDDLPSHIRDRFGNDPGAFLDFTSNSENLSEIAKMGLLTPEATEAILYPPAPTAAPAPKEPS